LQVERIISESFGQYFLLNDAVPAMAIAGERARRPDLFRGRRLGEAAPHFTGASEMEVIRDQF
jgi:hypothetical protein